MTLPASNQTSRRLWMDLALCAEVDPELFFPEKGHNDIARAAKRVCAACPVTAECLNFAFLIGADSGIFGGTTAEERRALLRQRRRAA
jgi:WhiB family transcriptional regulator, redox-sensing transcriptional regulator